MFNSLRKFDDWLTNWFTAFCWWTDVHFNKGNLWWARWCFINLMATLLAGRTLFRNLDFSVIGIIAALIMGIGIYIMQFIYWKIIPGYKPLKENAKLSPNPNRHSFEVTAWKIVPLIAYPILVFIFPAGATTFKISALIYVLSVYFLCAESMPPAEKQKRLMEKDARKMKLIPV